MYLPPEFEEDPSFIPVTKSRVECQPTMPYGAKLPSVSKASYSLLIQLASSSYIRPVKLSVTVSSPLSVNLGCWPRRSLFPVDSVTSGSVEVIGFPKMG